MQMDIPSMSQTRLSSKRLSQRFRIDRQGHPILRGFKLHSVTFIDDVVVGTTVHKTILVDCWKHHNLNDFRKKPSQCCEIS
ncbi:unnamed protein product (macronuclear) [Paramecium tetraurelia]|uniref:Uncharacterized protein n=1 Tax=Paramecium tetraurelia TaxID=5888 RepID=A0CQ57_PARTE|nr:uncharacterized protein GSPATT00009272001 [Paramecium tetraurelia]CAK72924.1 unnamed protein product [Paramecium tetraurelia]|eukprot:XP_001440321.1 hypothetical protein (macronuclear) [Paramecium tetraurelia strain d4-2]